MRMLWLSFVASIICISAPVAAAQGIHFSYTAELTRYFDDPDPSSPPDISGPISYHFVQSVGNEPVFGEPPYGGDPDFYVNHVVYDVFAVSPDNDPIFWIPNSDANSCISFCLKSFIEGNTVYFQSTLYPGYGDRLITFSFDHDLGGQFPTSSDGFISGYFSDGGGHIGYTNINSGPIRSLSIYTPEPATWAMMLVGFGFIGGALRARREAFAIA